MKHVHINAGNGYDVIIGSKIMKDAGEYCVKALKLSPERIRLTKLAVFTDSNVGLLYGKELTETLRKTGFEVCLYEFPQGEESKNIITVTQFAEFLSSKHFSRKDAVVVLGGGVSGDMGGFAASVYMRGIKFIQIPTSLLAAVDSSVGGKTGVDLSSGKNLMGTFWQPSLVLCDTDNFGSLSQELVLDGMAEIIKTAAIRDAELWNEIKNDSFGNQEYSDGPGQEVIARCVSIKGDVVEKDEKESGLRKILNFGHTMAHAIEKHSCYRISHGKAVAIGMLMVTAASEKQGLSAKGTYQELFELLSKRNYKLEYSDADISELCSIAAGDKKADGDKIGLVYLKKIGEAAVIDVKLDGLEDFFS